MLQGVAALHCWDSGAARTASLGMAGDVRVTKINHFYNGSGPPSVCYNVLHIRRPPHKMADQLR